MKYRRLAIDELKELETEFVRFLATNTVTSDDWVKIKAENPERAEGLIEQFSDIVFEKTLSNIEYLEFKTPKDIKIFHCEKEKITMVGLMVAGETSIDFSKDMPAEEMIQALKQSNAEVKLYRAEKNYKPNRKAELFKMLESGCLITNDNLFKTLIRLK